MEGGDVAETDEPFGVGAEREAIERSEELNTSVASSAAKDCPDFGVGEGFDEIGQALVEVSGKRAAAVESVGHYPHPESGSREGFSSAGDIGWVYN